MRGIDNTQRVSLDGSSSVRSRVIYGVRKIEQHRIQVGCVLVEHRYVAVWRPCDPLDDGPGAPWKDGLWQSVYYIGLPIRPLKDGSDKQGFELEEFEESGISALLPRIDLRLHNALREHLRVQTSRKTNSSDVISAE